MAVHAYDQYIYHIEDIEVKKVFQDIQKNHKQHAILIAERIQNLDGKPVDNVGIMGKATELMNTIKKPSRNTDNILKDALVGEYRGIEKSKKLLEGDLDPESLSLVEDILSVDEQHVELLDKFIQ